MFTLAARLALGIALLGVWLSASADPSYACSCVPAGSPSEALDYSDAVFRGVVKSIHEYECNDGAACATTEFDVSAVWKGPLSRTNWITTYGSNCAFGFSVGKEYIVYSYGGSTGICGRTHNLAMGFPDDDYNDLEELGSGQAPTGDPMPAPDMPSSGGCGRAAAGADVWWAALAVGVAWLGRRGTGPR